MEIAIGTPVYGREGQQVGEVSHVVVDGHTQQVTHVVLSKGWLLPRDIVVPVEALETTTPDEVRLQLNEDEVERQPDFVETHYATPDEDDPRPSTYMPGRYLYQPVMPTAGMAWTMPYTYSFATPPMPTETEVNVPEGSVILTEGMDILAGNEKVGTLAGVRFHPRTERVSHLVISRGWWFPEERLVPRAAVAAVDERGVHLGTSPDELRRLR